MSNFFTSQVNNITQEEVNSNGYQPQQQHQDLPCYNNNYQQRFHELQSHTRQKNNGAWTYSSGDPVSVFEVRFKCSKGDFVLPGNSFPVNSGDFVKVETDRGFDIGLVFCKKDNIRGNEIPRRKILGRPSQEEMSILPLKMAEESEAVKICRQMAAARGLSINIADVEFQFDRSKLTVVFASEGRVDFRELVRDMFSFFRIRIWMQKVSPSEAFALRQVAERDGASRFREESGQQHLRKQQHSHGSCLVQDQEFGFEPYFERPVQWVQRSDGGNCNFVSPLFSQNHHDEVHTQNPHAMKQYRTHDISNFNNIFLKNKFGDIEQPSIVDKSRSYASHIEKEHPFSDHSYNTGRHSGGSMSPTVKTTSSEFCALATASLVATERTVSSDSPQGSTKCCNNDENETASNSFI